MKTDLDQLIIDCRAALGEDKPQAALREVLRRAVSRPPTSWRPCRHRANRAWRCTSPTT